MLSLFLFGCYEPALNQKSEIELTIKKEKLEINDIDEFCDKMINEKYGNCFYDRFNRTAFLNARSKDIRKRIKEETLDANEFCMDRFIKSIEDNLSSYDDREVCHDAFFEGRRTKIFNDILYGRWIKQ